MDRWVMCFSMILGVFEVFYNILHNTHSAILWKSVSLGLQNWGRRGCCWSDETPESRQDLQHRTKVWSCNEFPQGR